MSNKKILYYLNQFFGQIGGEDKASMEPILKDGGIGPSKVFNDKIGDKAEVVATIICGDNYFNENKEKAVEYLKKVNDEIKPDIVIAGPAFNAGRYGMACAGVAEVFSSMNIPVITGMYEENPGVDIAKKISYVIKTANSAADMKKAIPEMVNIADKIIDGKKIKPEVDNYIAQGKRLTVFSKENGAKRAVDMLMARLNNEDFKTELPMPIFDSVDPAPAIKDLSKARIALVTSGGIVPLGNPDKIQSASAQKWGKYDISQIDKLTGKFCTIHGGYDPVYANEIPDRVVPLDTLKQFEKDGKIGHVHDWFYTTTGTGTAIGNAIVFGKEIGKELKEAGVDGVILTST